MVAQSVHYPWLGLMSGTLALSHSLLDSWAKALGASERAETRIARSRLRWRAASEVVVELPTMTLRATPPAERDRTDRPIVVVAPFAVHNAQVADFAPGHSVVEALADAGSARVFVTDWRSATSEMQHFGIDQYLADLHIALSDLGTPADVVGLCQGGWLALVYAARFPGSIRRLVLAGAPVDVTAGESLLSRLARDVPMTTFDELLRLGGGRLRGDVLLSLWSLAGPDRAKVLASLERSDDGSRPTEALIRRFFTWHAEFVDLPGAFYRETVLGLFKENRLARGAFSALGKRMDLGAVRCPLFVLAASNDQVTHPAQAFAVRTLVGTEPAEVTIEQVPGNHLTLYMGQNVLAQTWRRIGSWLTGQDALNRVAA